MASFLRSLLAAVLFFVMVPSFAQPSLAKMQQKLTAEKLPSPKSFYKFDINSKLPTQAGLLFSPDLSLQKSNLQTWLSGKLDLRQGIDALTEGGQPTAYAGTTISKLQQYYKGIKVEHGIVSAVAINNKVSLLQLEFYPIPSDVSSGPLLTEEAALQKAALFVGAEKYVWDGYKGKDADFQKPKGELVIVEDIFNDIGKMCLAYKFNIYASIPLSRNLVYVNAVSGKVVFSDAIIKHAVNDRKGFVDNETNRKKPAGNYSGNTVSKFTNSEIIAEAIANTHTTGLGFFQGDAYTKYSGTQQIQTEKIAANLYRLRDSGRGHDTRVETYNATHDTEPFDAGRVRDITDADNDWSAGEYLADTTNGAFDAHWAAEQVVDYWWAIHGRKSYDNNDGVLKGYYHYDVRYDNAFWNGTGMYYGDGTTTGNKYNTWVSLDICGHEIGHAVCEKTAGLVYQRESGALNEGFSDIWGACIEHYAETQFSLVKKPFLFGEEIMENGKEALRNMRYPRSPQASSQCADTYKVPASGWQDVSYEGCPSSVTGYDHCGVHFNSGVLNRWFYLLIMGGDSTNGNNYHYTVSRIGFDSTEKLAFFTEQILTPNSGYEAARIASINAARILGWNADIANILEAWKAVGVFSDSLYNIANTPIFVSHDFKSIGVGKYGCVWAGTANNGLYKFDGKTWQKAPVLTNHNIADIKTDWNGGIWIGQYGRTGAQAITGGIDYFADSSFTNRHWGSFNGLPTRNVRSIFVNNDTSLAIDPLLTKIDTFRRVWCAAMSDITAGVSRPGYVARGKQGVGLDTPFNMIALGTDVNNGLVQTIGGYNKEVWAFAPNNFGHNQILRYKVSDTSFIGYVDETNSTLPAGFTAKAIYFDTAYKKWWVGMLSGGVYVYDIVNPGWTQINFPTIFPSGTIINNNAITGDKRGNIYIGTTNGYVFYGSPNAAVKLKPDSLPLYKRFTMADGLPSNNVKSICVDYRGARILLATDSGIVFKYTLCNECINSGPVYTDRSGNWNNPAIWSTAAVPGLNANVIVRHPVVVTEDANCNSLKLQGAGNVTVNSGVLLNVEGVSYIATGRH